LKTVVFTDLDGTLLDRDTYSYAVAVPALERLRQNKIPLVFCSAKTRAEQEAYRSELGISDPFIVENGGAIFIPHGYFPFVFDYHKASGEYSIIELGMPYHWVREILAQVRSQLGLDLKGFGDMSAEEVAAETGLSLEAARRAKEREYDETLKLDGTSEEIERALSALEKAGLSHTHGGRYYNIMGANDKGKAATILIDLFHRKLGQIETIGIGDSLNDLPMLAAVDIPVLVQKPGGVWEQMDLPRLHRVEGAGPVGWRRAIEELVIEP
jgi:mannosyl-3-phosphoglycerate phosphatase